MVWCCKSSDADYEPMSEFGLADVQARLPVAEAFIATMKQLANRPA